MPVVFSQGGYPIAIPPPGDLAFWAIKFTNDTWVCERDIVTDLLTGQRFLDWTLDIHSTGDWKRIKELWLLCPPSKASPLGATASLPITTPGTAFQLKVAMMDGNMVQARRGIQAHLIGRVMDESGACECFIYDYVLEGLLTFPTGEQRDGEEQYGPFKSNVYHFGTWRGRAPGRPGIAPLGPLNLKVLGIHLPERA